MIPVEAQAIVQEVLAPEPLDRFLDEVMDRRFLHLKGDPDHPRSKLMGPDPAQALLDAWQWLSPNMTHHAARPTGPAPAMEQVASAEAFADKIEALHANGYTARLPDIRSTHPDLERFVRALESLFHKPVRPMVFWSRDDAAAPVHHDSFDLIIIQLKGRKRWFISGDPSNLPNTWENIPSAPEQLHNPVQLEVGPGDLLYLPRGVTHRVEAVADSIHLSIAFVPLTLREALIACIDQLSDLERPLRASVGSRLLAQTRASSFGNLPHLVRVGLEHLRARCASDEFIAGAVQRRSARAVGDMEKLKRSGTPIELTPATRVRHNTLAISHLTANSEKIDFAYPGGHHYVHRGAEESLLFIANTPEFQLRDIPGDLPEDVRVAMADKFVSCGFLEVIEA